MKKQIFEQKGNLSNEKNFVGYFFLVLWNMKNVRKHFIRVNKVFWHENDKIISLGPKWSIETIISKINCFNGDKKLWPIFPRIVDCDKHQGLVY